MNVVEAKDPWQDRSWLKAIFIVSVYLEEKNNIKTGQFTATDLVLN